MAEGFGLATWKVEGEADPDAARYNEALSDAEALAPGPVKFMSFNSSGIYPTEFKVLILPNAVEEVTKGGIIVPDMTKDKLKYAEMEGRIIALAPAAFSFIADDEWHGQKPAPGDRVIIAKYAGVRVKGDDGIEYVLINDKDVTAIRK